MARSRRRPSPSRWLRLRATAAMVLAMALVVGHGPARAAADGPRKLPSPMVGVTLDTVEHLPETIEALAALPVMPVARIVFDRGPVGLYTAAVDDLRPVAFLMGELVDPPTSAATRSPPTASGRAATTPPSATGSTCGRSATK